MCMLYRYALSLDHLRSSLARGKKLRYASLASMKRRDCARQARDRVDRMVYISFKASILLSNASWVASLQYLQ